MGAKNTGKCMGEYRVKDIKMAEEGEKLIYWAERHMPVLGMIKERFKEEKPLNGLKITACLHVTKETAVLMKTLLEGGAMVSLSAANPLSTQDHVAAALASIGVHVFAWKGESAEEYYENIDRALSIEPDIVLDDGGDLNVRVHGNRPELANKIIGGCEETTTGVIRALALEKDGILKYPIIAVNEATTKSRFDNVYGTGQSTIDGIIRATNILFAGKTVVVAGYGRCGYGIAWKARGLGANVVVTEVDPVKALMAAMDGFRVLPMSEACRIGDIFITATGNKDVIRGEHILMMKEGAILANAGHFNVEISVNDLNKLAVDKRRLRPHVDEYILENGRRVYLLAKGRVVNLVAAEGHPSEVMDMSFSNQALCVEYIAKNREKLGVGVHKVPVEVDMMVAKLKLATMGIVIDELSEEQKKYLKSWSIGT